MRTAKPSPKVIKTKDKRIKTKGNEECINRRAAKALRKTLRNIAPEGLCYLCGKEI